MVTDDQSNKFLENHELYCEFRKKFSSLLISGSRGTHQLREA